MSTEKTVFLLELDIFHYSSTAFQIQNSFENALDKQGLFVLKKQIE